MRPTVRVALSLVLVLAAYGAYAVTAVPLIEPRVEAATDAVAPVPTTPPSSETGPTDRMYRWFGPDRHAWELRKPKMLRNDQGILLFDKYVTDPEKLGPKKVRLEPVSLVFLSDDETLDPQVRDRQAVIMRAPMGAVLEFDQPFNILRGDVGSLVGGMLTGKVVIHSDGKSPGPEDDLRIVTQDVQLKAGGIASGGSVTTNAEVEFEYGPNRGRGAELEIHLLPEEERRDTPWGRIQTLKLKRNVSLDLVVKESASGPDGSSANAAGEFSPEQPIIVHQGGPVKLKCRGPFELNAPENIAAFEQWVVVTRQPPVGAPEGSEDRLKCHRLELHLASPPKHQASAAGNNGGSAAKDAKPAEGKASRSSAPKVDVRRVVALGIPGVEGQSPPIPAVLEAPSSRAYAKGGRLEYDMETRRVSLIDSQENVVFRHETNEIQARELHYQPGPDGRLGRFEAEGEGWLNWQARDVRGQGQTLSPAASSAPDDAADQRNGRRFLARWSRKLFSVPSQGRQAISMLGKAKAQVTGMGRLEADEIHVWLIEQPASPASTRPTKQKRKYDLLPDQMMALSGGKDSPVVIDSTQVTGRAEEKLEVLIQQAADPLGGRLESSASGAASPAPGGSPASGRADGFAPRSSPLSGRIAANAGADAAPSSQRFDVAGRHMQMKLVQIGQEMQWRQIDILGGARLWESRVAKPGELPFRVTGDCVHARQAEADAGQVTVVGYDGNSAHIEGRGLSLTGLPAWEEQQGKTQRIGRVNLDQRANRIWVAGPGLMTLVVDRDLQGEKLSKPSPIEIAWQKSMDFDGQRAVFSGAPSVKQAEATLRTTQLEAVLSQRIDLAHPKQGGPRPQLDRVICQGGLLLDRPTSDARGPLAHERLQAADLTIDQVSGAIFGNGPGWLTRVSRRDSELEGPAIGKRPATATPSKTQGAGATPFTPPADPDKPLNYLRVDFQDAMRGNLHQRVIVFSNQVQAVHAPVRRWDDTVSPDWIEHLGPRGVVLKCDELHLNEMRGPGDAKWFEASARGNTNVEGESFTAQAAQLNYSQDKDLLILQGTDRAPAELWRQQGPGTPRSHLAARKIEFWRRDNHIKIDKAQYLDVDNIPADKGRSRPKPSGR
jgi:lipopolysaccharide export system protein LptA